MIERLFSRIHFAVFAPDLGFDDGFPAAADGAFLRQKVSGGKTLAAFRVQLPYEGYYDEQPSYEVRVTRFLPDGVRDRTFGRNGRLVVGEGYQDVKYVPGKRILVSPDPIIPEAAIQAYTLNGRVDTSFGGGDGVAETPGLTKPDGTVARGEPALVAVLDDGRMIFQSAVNLADSYLDPRDDTFYLSRLNADGSFDKTFGKKGFAVFKPGKASVDTFVRPSGIYVRYDNGYLTDPPSGALMRLSLNGKDMDTAFGTNGRLTLPPFVNTLVEQPDGKLLYFDTTYGRDPVLYRVKHDGTPDTSFSGDGKITLSYADTSGSDTAAREGVSLAIDGQNRVVVSANGTIFRFSPNGTMNGYPFNGTVPFPTRIASVDDAGGVMGTDGKRYALVQPQQLDAEGIVQITTDSRDDEISVADAGNGKVRVIVNDESKLFRTRQVKGISLRTFDGQLGLRVRIDVPVTLLAGDGDATITTGGGNDKLNVANGDHTIDLGGGDDSADIGESIRSVDSDRHTVVGSGGNKAIEVVSGSLTVTLPAGDHEVRALGDAQQVRITIAGGNNTLYLSGENSVAIVGGSGKNTVTAFGERDSIVTGEGPDTVLAISSQGTFRTGGGDDQVTVRNFSQAPTTGSTVYAGAGDDQVFTDRNYQTLATVYGGEGNDKLEGWTLSQRLYGEAGNDTLSGQDGNDYLYGGDGDDLVIGGASSDRLFGDAGNDRLYGQSGNDKLYGGAGNDRLFAQAGSDELFGEEGNDRLHADTDAGQYVLRGGPDTDLFFTRNDQRDTLFGDGGADRAESDNDDVLNSVTRTAK